MVNMNVFHILVYILLKSFMVSAILTEDESVERFAFIQGASRVKRHAVMHDYEIWPNGIIRYKFHPGINEEVKVLIKMAMKTWESKTCIKFKPLNEHKVKHVLFRTDKRRCSSVVGNQPFHLHVQDVNIPRICLSIKNANHELGHVIGLWHEQNRLDRNKYVTVLQDNIVPRAKFDYEQHEGRRFSIPYNYASVMHYRSMSWAKKLLEVNTLVTNDPKYTYFQGISINPNFYDFKLVNMLYRCTDLCNKKNECENQGYLTNIFDSCECLCPPGTTGVKCEMGKPKLYDTCGKNIMDEGNFSTPGYPGSTKDKFCTWIIKAPPNHRLIRLEIYGFNLTKRVNKKDSIYNGKCLHEWVEIRLNSSKRGNFYCGQDLKPGSVFQGEEITLILNPVKISEIGGDGFEMNVKFVDQSKSNQNL